MHLRTWLPSTGIALVVALVAVDNFGCGGGSTSALNNNGSGGGGGGPVPASVSGTIAVGAFPVGMAVDPTSNKVYVVNSPLASFCKNLGAVPGVVTLIDGTTGSVAGTANNLSPFEINSPVSTKLRNRYVMITKFQEKPSLLM